MRSYTTLVACAALLLSSVPALADSATPLAGKDNKVEWQQISQWKIDGQPIDFAHSLDGKLVYVLNNQNQVVIYDTNGQLQGKLSVPEGTSRIAIAPQGEALYLTNGKTKTFTSLAINFIFDIQTAGSPVKGNVNSPVSLVIFTDFECPYCIKLEPILNQVFEKNKDKIKMVFKNFPLSMHPMADPAHRAAMAADNQGKFWEFHDKLFASKLSQEGIDTIAKELGLDFAKFKKDMESAEIQKRVSQDLADGEKSSVTGTPTVFINGRKVQQRTPEAFQQMIDDELKKKGR